MANRRRLFVAALLSAAALIAACTSSSDPKNKPNSSPDSPSVASSSPTPINPSSPLTPSSQTTTMSTTATVEQAVQDAWLNYWKVSLALAKYPRAGWPARVKAISVNPIYTELLNSIRVQQDKLGQVGYGYVISHPYWPKPPTTTTKSVVMGDCFDGSHAGTKLSTTGKVKTVGKPQTNIHATLVKGVDDKWRVNQIQYLKTSC